MPRRRRPSPDPKLQARRVVRALVELYPEARCALDHRDAFELLVATILSAQCTDARVNLVTPALFARYPDPASPRRGRAGRARGADPLDRLLPGQGEEPAWRWPRPVVAEHGGEVPADLDALTALPGRRPQDGQRRPRQRLRRSPRAWSSTPTSSGSRSGSA